MSTATAEKPSVTALREFTTSRGVTLKVDREAGVLRGVKILGLESKNGRTYLAEAVKSAMPLYEGARVNINHPKGSPNTPRDYQDRMGVVRNVEQRADGLYGDLHYNPKHSLAEQLAWDAEHAPENVGLSHNVQARVTSKSGKQVVEAITHVQSVDLVADPATTKGLFEGEGYMDPNDPGAGGAGGDPLETFQRQLWADLEAVFMGDGDAAAKKAAFNDALKKSEAVKKALAKGGEKPAGDGEPDAAAKAETESLKQQIAGLKEQVDRFTAKEAAAEKRTKVNAELVEAKLMQADGKCNEKIVSKLFVEQLMASDDATRKSLIEDRKAIAAGVSLSSYTPPRSVPGGDPITEGAAAVPDKLEDFAAKLKG